MASTEPPSGPHGPPYLLPDGTPGPEPIAVHPLFILRPYHASDIPSIQLMTDDASVVRFMTLNIAFPYTLEHATNWFGIASAPHSLSYAICCPVPITSTSTSSTTTATTSPSSSGTESSGSGSGQAAGAGAAYGYDYVGAIGFKLPPDLAPEEAHKAECFELGYLLGKPHWGKGIMSAATVEITKWVFRKFPALKRVEGLFYDGNVASGKVLEKAGYEFVETRPKFAKDRFGTVVDVHVWRMDREKCVAAGAGSS